MAVTGASLNPIYQRLNGADEYHPFDADTFSDWSMEAGDVVTVSRGSDSYQSPIHSMKVVWKGAPQTTISSTGKKERDTVTKQAKRKYGRGGSGLRSSQGLGHKIEETDEHWQSMYWDGYNGLSSRIEQTASYWQAEFNNMYDGLRGFVEITAEHWRAEFEDSYNGLIGYVDQTAEHWHAEFQNAYAGLVGYVEVTAEGWHSEFQNAYTGMIGYVDATAEHWMSVLENTESGLRSSIQQQANRIGLVVEGTGDNAHIKAAEIVASINDQTGESQVRLAADKVLISGTTKLNDVFTVTDDYVQALVSIYAAPGAVFNGDHVGSFYYNQQEHGHSVSYGILKKAEVDTSTNTLKIWKFGDADGSPSITFKKAAAVSGSWSGSTFTAQVADSGAQSVTTSVILQIEGAANPNTEFYAKVYKDNPQDPTNQLESTKITLLENVNSKKVYAHTGSGTSRIDKGAISTAATYNAGWDYGLTQRVRTAAEATSQEVTVKSLTFGQRWTIKDTYTASNGTTSDVKYTVSAPSLPSVTLTWNGATGSSAGSTNNITGACGSNSATDYIKMYSSSGTVYVRHNSSASAVETSGTVIAKLTDSNLAAGNIKNGVSIFGVTGNYTGSHSVTLTWNGTTGTNAGSTNNIKGTCGGATTYDYIKMYSSSGTIYVRHNTSASAVESSGTIIAKLTDSNLAAGNIKNGVSIFGVAGSYAPVSTVTAEWQQTNPSSSANPYNKYVIKRDGNTLSNLTITVTAGASISYNSGTHTYTATGTASAGGSQRGSATATSGTEAYSAGFDKGVANSWFVYTSSTYNDQGPLAPNTRIEIGYTDLNGTWHRRGTWSTPSSGGGGTIERIIDVYPVDDNDVEMDHDITISSPINIRACATYVSTTSEYVQYRYGSNRIKITPSGGDAHPNSVTFTKGSMSTEQAGGRTIYRFTYSLTNTTGSWPCNGRTTFYY